MTFGPVQIHVVGRTTDGAQWHTTAIVDPAPNPALTAVWARAHLRDLEDRYVVGDPIEERIVATSLRFGVLCRFTAFVAIDSRVVTEGGTPHRVMQPVEPVSGWDMLREPPPAFTAAPRAMSTSMTPMAQTASTMDAEAGPPMRPAGMAAGGLSSAGRSMAGSIESVTAEAYSFATKAAARFRRGPDPLTAARAQVADEARRLREAAASTERERRTMLADLGSRLEALAVHLNARGHAKEAAPLHQLAISLRNCDLPQPLGSASLERLWQRTLEVLDAFTAGHGPGGDDTGGERPGPGSGGSSGASGGGSGNAGGSDLSGATDTGGARRRDSSFWKRS